MYETYGAKHSSWDFWIFVVWFAIFTRNTSSRPPYVQRCKFSFGGMELSCIFRRLNQVVGKENQKTRRNLKVCSQAWGFFSALCFWMLKDGTKKSCEEGDFWPTENSNGWEIHFLFASKRPIFSGFSPLASRRVAEVMVSENFVGEFSPRKLGDDLIWRIFFKLVETNN